MKAIEMYQEFVSEITEIVADIKDERGAEVIKIDGSPYSESFYITIYNGVYCSKCDDGCGDCDNGMNYEYNSTLRISAHSEVDKGKNAKTDGIYVGSDCHATITEAISTVKEFFKKIRTDW